MEKPPKVAKSRAWAALVLLTAEQSQHAVAAKTDVKQSTISKLVNLQKIASRIDALRFEASYGWEVSWWDVPPTAAQERAIARIGKAA